MKWFELSECAYFTLVELNHSTLRVIDILFLDFSSIWSWVRKWLFRPSKIKAIRRKYSQSLWKVTRVTFAVYRSAALLSNFVLISYVNLFATKMFITAQCGIDATWSIFFLVRLIKTWSMNCIQIFSIGLSRSTKDFHFLSHYCQLLKKKSWKA